MPPEIYRHSDIQEIMVTKPSFILKWGNTLISCLLLVLLAFAAWFEYPEFITTDVLLATQDSTASLAAPAGNRGATLLVPNGSFVRRGTPLVVWQDADQTDYQEAQRLKSLLGPLPAAELARRLRFVQPTRLGQLRPVYQGLQTVSTGGALPAAHSLADYRQQLRRWEDKAVALAPRDGIAQVSAPGWSAAAPIPTGQAVLRVRPRQNTYLALGEVSREQYAVVRRGQQVLLQVHELGSQTLVGRVMTIAPLAVHFQHRVVIQLSPVASPRLYPSFSGSARIMLRQQSLLTKFMGR